MSDKPMTLRQKIEYEMSKGVMPLGVQHALQMLLTETDAADAERDRLARIGELVMQIIRLKQAFTYLGMGPHGARTAAIGGVEATSHLNTPTESLLAALEALNEKVKS